MIKKILTGNIFESKAQTLVNTVNCVGVMGKGIAVEFKKRFPDMFRDYLKRCNAQEVKLGKPYLFRQLTPPWIINFPTKDHWRSSSDINNIINGLKYLQENYKKWGIESLAMPPLGCGQGGLKWQEVGPILYKYLKELKVPVELYAPEGTPNDELDINFLRQPAQHEILINWLILVRILAQIEEKPYHYYPLVGRTTFQKIAYFATVLEIPTNLHFQRCSFGPYDPNLKNIIQKLVNFRLIREEKKGKMLAIKVEPEFFKIWEAHKSKLTNCQDKIDRITDLFLRMNTIQAEIAASAHFVAKELIDKRKEKPTEKEVLIEVMNWKQKRRPPLEESEVATGIRNLNILGWLDLELSEDLPIEEEYF